MDKYEKQHQRNLTTYERQVDAIFTKAIKEAALLGVSIGDLADNEILSFDKLPKTKKAVNKMLQTLANNLEVCIVNGVQSAWTLANNKDNELCNQVFGDAKDTLTSAQRKRYYSNNDDALQAFLDRKEAGLTLSERVWKYADEFKEEVEMGLDLGIRNGVAANKMQKNLKQYLQHPDVLFRRVRDVHGNLQLSKRAKAYHPGTGVYRSSYKNARRLTVTETNMAYRTADYLRWQNLDFVVGIRVVLSNNHPVSDICNELSAPLGSTANKGQGCYPKDFKFVGWHPHCRCHSESILKTQEELMVDNKRIMNGEKPLEGSVNAVTTLPQGFTDWVKANEERINTAKNLPYFLRDNRKAMKQALTTAKVTTPLTSSEKARRKEIEKKAKKTLRGLEMRHADLGKPITISGQAIKEWLNQPFADYFAKNEALLRLPELLSEAVYIGSGTDRHNGEFLVHLFQTKISKTTAWIIVRENKKEECWVHSISDSEVLLDYVIKKKKE